MGCRLYIGCCGFPFARSRYYKVFRTVELQRTFYDLPEPEYADKLRGEAPSDFHWNMKAWQALTHPLSSPTWRRAKRKPSGNPENIGLLKPTKENLEAWRRVREFAERLGARVVVLQTPPSLKPSREAAEWIKRFFTEINASETPFTIGWEPRGGWNSKPDLLQDTICGTGVIHVVDPLRARPLVCSGQRVLYYRLHGRGGGEVNYRYRYTEDDFHELAEILKKDLDIVETVYVMFNNVYMGDDARRFREYLKTIGLEAC